MKKVLSFLLTLCILTSLALTVGASPAFAAVQSLEEFEQLKQQAEAGDSKAMEELANTYYRGSYNVGISRDFVQALNWFLRAADAGNTDVYVTIATIYEKGSTGERDLEKAYEWYQRAAESGSQEAQEATQSEKYESYHWKDSVATLSGTLGEYSNLGGRYGTPFYLDNPVVDCSQLILQLSFIEYRGWPFGTYGLFAMAMNGSWMELGRFQIEKFQAEEGAEPRLYSFELSTPQSFKALGVVLLEDGMDFNLKHEDVFYVDKACISDYSDAVPAPMFTPSGASYPENAGSFAYTAYSDPTGPV